LSIKVHQIELNIRIHGMVEAESNGQRLPRLRNFRK
jgi:hypothetical protein